MAPARLSFQGARGRGRAIVRALGLRVLVWGGLVGVVLAYATDFRWWSAHPTPPQLQREEIQTETKGGPGWPHLRGPSYDGVSPEKDLADAWPAQGPPLAWMQHIGRGYSGVIAKEDRVYTQRQNATEQSVICLDAETGRLIWEHRCGWAYEPGGMYPGPRATPTWHEGRIYFATPDGRIGCLRASDGRPIWSVNVLDRFGGRGTEFGYSCSPLVEAGLVVLPVGGPTASLVALDALTGAVRWTSGSEPASYCSAVPIDFQGRRLVIAFLQNVLAACELQSGRLLWQRPYSRGYDEHAALPVYEEPHLMVMLPFRAGADIYRLEAQPNKDPQESDVAVRLVRHTAELSCDTASSVLVGGHVYGFDLHEAQANGRRASRGRFKCLKFPSAEVCWSTDRVGHATILVADTKMFLFNDKGELVLARLNPERYEELGRVRVFQGEICWTAPALADGRLFLRSPTRLACLLVGKSAQSSIRGWDAPVRSAPAPAQTSEPLGLVWLIGKEREYPFDPPDTAEWTRSYLWALAAIGAAWMLGLLSGGVAARCQVGTGWRVGAAVFWFAAFLLGWVLSPVANRVGEGFVLTWPLSMFVFHEAVLAAVIGTAGYTPPRLPRWFGPTAVWLLVLACVGYYELGRQLSLPFSWVFLMGFLPSWPLAIPLARRLLGPDRAVCERPPMHSGSFEASVAAQADRPRPGSGPQDVSRLAQSRGSEYSMSRFVTGTAIWMVLAFSLYFWVSAGCLWLKTAWTR